MVIEIITKRLYEHYDFALEEKALIPKSEVWHYAMTRDPKKV